MPIDQLLAALEREARGSAELIAADARRQAEAITAAGQAELAERRQSARQAAESRARASADQALAQAARDARRDVLLARERLLDRVLAAANALLPGAIERPEYLATLAPRIAEASRCVGDRPATVHGPPALEAPLRNIATGFPQLTVAVDAGVGAGFVLTGSDGTITVEDTLQGRIRRDRASLARIALRVLEAPR